MRHRNGWCNHSYSRHNDDNRLISVRIGIHVLIDHNQHQRAEWGTNALSGMKANAAVTSGSCDRIRNTEAVLRLRETIDGVQHAEDLAEEALAEAHSVPHNEGIGETRVKDVWNWDDDVHPGWKAQIEDDYPKVFSVIQAVEACATENEAAYICFMAVRMIEYHRVLKPSGSIYVHCDSHANSYLRMLLDAIFGSDNLRRRVPNQAAPQPGDGFIQSHPWADGDGA